MQIQILQRNKKNLAAHDLFPVSFPISYAVVQSAHIDNPQFAAVIRARPFFATKERIPKNQIAIMVGVKIDIQTIKRIMPISFIIYFLTLYRHLDLFVYINLLWIVTMGGWLLFVNIFRALWEYYLMYNILELTEWCWFMWIWIARSTHSVPVSYALTDSLYGDKISHV